MVCLIRLLKVVESQSNRYVILSLQSLTKISQTAFQQKKRLRRYLPEGTLPNSKRERFSQILGKFWAFASMSHRPLPFGYFNRYDAEMAVGITTYLLSYIGKLLKAKQQE